MGTLKRVVQRAHHASFVRIAAQRVGAARGRALVLLYHQLMPEPLTDGVTPSVSVAQFEEQVAWLKIMGYVVPLRELLNGARGSRPRFAITFDDDYESHARYALPVLRRHGVTATFFLSGRWLHGLGPYWWEELDHSIATMGFAAVAQAVGVNVGAPAELVARVERDPHLQVQVEQLAHREAQPIPDRWFSPLMESDLDIGFHTLHHPMLTDLDDDALHEALIQGRADLAEAAGRELKFFAYPHGRAASREAYAVEEEGFVAAFTASKDPVGAVTDRYLSGRWEPGALSPGDFAAELAWRLNAPIRPVRN